MALGDFSLGLDTRGACWAWGYNIDGQVGDNSTTNRSSPVSVVGAHSFTSIAGGGTHSLGLKSSDGSCWAWGLNTSGQVGDNLTTTISSPVSVVGAHSFMSIAGGTSHSLGLKSSDGSCWAWGLNTNGRLGDNSATTRSSPVSVVGAHSFTSIAGGGSHSLGLKSSDGSCWDWGLNTNGQLGNKSVAQQSSPVSVVGAHSFTSIAGGTSHSLGLKSSDGSCWAWGLNSGRLGDNSITTRSSPVSVVGAHSFTSIAGGGIHSLGLKSPDGSCWAWGLNTDGQLGNNSVTIKSSPVSVVGAHSFIQIAGFDNHSLGLKSNGQIWAWGDMFYGQLGDNDCSEKISPVSVVGSHSFSLISANCNSQNTFALKSSDGSCWGWGYNIDGEVGDNTIVIKSSPVSVVGAHSFTSIGTGGQHTLALKSPDGSCWAWGGGNSNSGQLGNNTTTDVSSPVSVVGAHSFTSIAAGAEHTLALKSSNGSCWAWGQNTSAQLGDNSATNRSSPVSVVGAHSFTSIAGGAFHSLALKSSDGSCWAWGYNVDGELADNTVVSRSSPISVVGAHSFTSIAGGSSHSLGLKSSDGSCWAWGLNTHGPLGDNSITNRSSPVSVVGAHSFISIAGGGIHSLGLKSSDGSCWAWGLNTNGQLGNNDPTYSTQSSPVSVVGGFSFSAITCQTATSFGVDVNGQVWGWGDGSVGYIGNNESRAVVSPVMVVGGMTFAKIDQQLSSAFASQVSKVAGVPKASISKVSGVPVGSISKISSTPNS